MNQKFRGGVAVRRAQGVKIGGKQGKNYRFQHSRQTVNVSGFPKLLIFSNFSSLYMEGVMRER